MAEILTFNEIEDDFADVLAAIADALNRTGAEQRRQHAGNGAGIFHHVGHQLTHNALILFIHLFIFTVDSDRLIEIHAGKGVQHIMQHLYGVAAQRLQADQQRQMLLAKLLQRSAVKLKPAENLRLTLGRFGTDYGYGSLPWRIPLIADNSSRTIQTISEGALAHFEATENLEFWSMWRKRAFYYVDSATGVRDEGVINSTTGKYHPHRSRGYLVGSWHDASSRYSLGASYQQDVSTQVQSIVEKTYAFTDDRALKWELMGFYGQVEGMSKPLSYHHETALISGRLTYSFANARLFGAVGKLTHDIDGRIIYTDIGYPDSLSIDRNKEGMLSVQLGGQYFFTPNVGVMLGPILTHGYEDKQRHTRINGVGLMGAILYNVAEGPFKGLNMYIAADRAREKRPGSSLGDRLNYWDVKAGMQYDFMLK